MHGNARRGYTLIECALVCALVGIAAAIAIPGWRAAQLRGARLDAVTALTRLQAAQEQYRSLHGLYAAELRALRGVAATSPQGRYRIDLESTGADAYRASAHASGAQADDRDCATLTLEVTQGFASSGPSPGCWRR